MRLSESDTSESDRLRILEYSEHGLPANAEGNSWPSAEWWRSLCKGRSSRGGHLK